MQFRLSTEDEVESSDDFDDFSVPETEDEASLSGDSDGILEAVLGLFKSNQKLVLARTQEQVSDPFENLNQVREVFSMG